MIPKEIRDKLKERTTFDFSKITGINQRSSEYEWTNHPYKRKKNGKKQSCPKHRAVWMENFGEIPKDFVIHHINGDKKDNRIENLECLSRKEHGQRHRKIK